MKTSFALCLLLFGTTTILLAQTETVPTSWKWNMGASLNGSQAQYRDWAPGGVNAVSATGAVFLKGAYKKDALSFDTELNLKYGGADIENIGFRKTDDLIRFTNVAGYAIANSAWSYFGRFDFNTQFYEGRNGAGLLISDFMAPAYLQEGAGMQYKPVSWFTAKSGLGLKQTYVSDTLYATGFGVKAGENWRNEAGFTLSFRLEKEIMKNVLLKSGFDSFTNLERHIENTDVMFTNEFIGKINKYLSTNLQLAFAYDSDIIRRVQIKQVLSVGISVQFF
jgi:hypothetical protein